jgi:hypothetical protein
MTGSSHATRWVGYTWATSGCRTINRLSVLVCDLLVPLPGSEPIVWSQMELARLGLEREGDFREMLSGFARTQAALMQASADAWTTLSRQFDSPGDAGLQGGAGAEGA